MCMGVMHEDQIIGWRLRRSLLQCSRRLHLRWFSGPEYPVQTSPPIDCTSPDTTDKREERGRFLVYHGPPRASVGRIMSSWSSVRAIIFPLIGVTCHNMGVTYVRRSISPARPTTLVVREGIRMTNYPLLIRAVWPAITGYWRFGGEPRCNNATISSCMIVKSRRDGMVCYRYCDWIDSGPRCNVVASAAQLTGPVPAG